MLIEPLVEAFGYNLPVFALLFIGVVVEKHYVSRVTVFTNVLAVNIHLLSVDQTSQLMIWFADLGLVLGVYGMAQYLRKSKTPEIYNVLSYSLYSSFPVAAVILAAPSDFLPVLVLTGLVNFAGGFVVEDVFDIEIGYWGPRPAEVSQFISSETMKYVDAVGVNHTVDLTMGFDP